MRLSVGLENRPNRRIVIRFDIVAGGRGEAMSTKKPSSVRAKGKSAAAGRKRNPEGVSRVWGGSVTESAGGNGNRRNSQASGRVRNPADINEESEEILKANELLLRVWENVHAKRGGLGKLR